MTNDETAQSTDVAEGSEATAKRFSQIKIGTQRTGETVRLAEPIPVLAPNPVTPAAPSPGEAKDAAAGKKPQAKAPTKHFPPPNIRHKLTPDLEMEFAEAIGDVPIDQMLSGELKEFEAELEPDTTVTARVIVVQRDLVFLDLGGRRQAVVKLLSFDEEPAQGSTLDVIVTRFNAEDGLYEVTLPGKAVDVGDWSQVSAGMIVEARITGHNKGGLECEVNQLRGFIPAGQISMYRVEDFSGMVGDKLNCLVMEANPERRNLVLSHRAVMERDKAAAKEKLLATLQVGDVREGIVRSLQEFGAFIDLGGVDGLIHISQLSWDRIRHASEALELGQKVKVKIQKIDPETGKIGLAFRDLAENPWDRAAEKYVPRMRVPGTVSRLMEFGAFVRLEPGIEGLVHISELDHKRVHRASDIVSEGQQIDVQIISVDAENQRISLSLKALMAAPAPTKAEEEDEEPAVEQAPAPTTRKSSQPLKGGVGTPTGGEKFGLKW